MTTYPFPLVPITPEILEQWKGKYSDFGAPQHDGVMRYIVQQIPSTSGLLIYGEDKLIACIHAQDRRDGYYFPNWIRGADAINLIAEHKHFMPEPELTLEEILQAEEVFNDLQGR